MEVLSSRLSLTRILLKTFIGESKSDFANTDEPIIAKTIFTPTLRRNVLLPAILEPVIRFSCPKPVVEKELGKSKLMVKIVEQESGKKQTNTYFFELNNKNGTPAIKPLLMLNMTRKPVKQVVPSNPPDTLNASTRLNHKKRVTS